MGDKGGGPAEETSDVRFRGITFPEAGGLRLSGLRLQIVDNEVVPSGDPTVEVIADIWHHWLDVARAHAADAELARDSNPGLDVPEEFGPALIKELRAAMVAVTSVAFSLEAFRTSVAQHLRSDRILAKSADGRVHQTLVRGFVLGNDLSKEVRAALRQIFPLRDYGVHPPAAWVVPVMHPAFNAAMDPKYVAFRTENAQTAVVVAERIATYCLDRPRKTQVDLVKWCDDMKQRISDGSEHAEEG